MSDTSASSPGRGVFASWLYTATTFFAMLALGAITVVLDAVRIGADA